MIPWPTGY
ncbi:Protein of unknown function [Lactobacillus helveticus CIRM-BIA 953]|uniref:Uncharacterized protein n=1 Tax=Lactobacillus helveticus CIRM-BIA 953 TaxID=1226335 RepID=U4QBS0_LACHE|nr:Protein of unknown function [Lactobacillus helveticus CIRM-BIA 953]